MGGERFDTPQPEAYLFGENADLNFLGSRPTPVSLKYKTNFYLLSKINIFKFHLIIFNSFHIHRHKLMIQQRH